MVIFRDIRKTNCLIHRLKPKNSANSSTRNLWLKSAMMLEYIGFNKAANLITKALEKTIADKIVTYDLARHMGIDPVKTSEFAKAILERMEK